MMSTELKPCPFCGGKAVLHEIPAHAHGPLAAFMPDHKGSAYVECAGCSCAISANDEKQAVQAWNRRKAADTISQLTEEVERLKTGNGDDLADRAKAALEAAHRACFKHPDRPLLGMSHGPFSGVNEALSIIAQLHASWQVTTRVCEKAQVRAEAAEAQAKAADAHAEKLDKAASELRALCDRQAVALSRAEARVKVLEEALAPFAKAGELFPPRGPGE